MCSWLVRGVELFIARHEDRPTSNGIAPEEKEERLKPEKRERERDEGGYRKKSVSLCRSADRIG